MLALLALIVVPFLLFEDRALAILPALDGLAGLPVLLVAAVILSLTLDVFLPVPSSLVMLFAGATLGPLAGGVAIWVGLTAGCLLGYAAGAWAGTPAFRWWLGPDALEDARLRVRRFGTVPLIATRPVPVLAEAATLLAGATGYPLGRFALVVALSNGIIAALYAALARVAPETHFFLFAMIGVLWLAVMFLAAGRLIGGRVAQGDRSHV